MSKVAVVYWSGTGNTEAMADMVAEGIGEAGGRAEVIQAGSFSAGKAGEYDAFAFGCPAMGDEELEDMEFEPMYSEVEPLLGERKVVLFGSFSWNEGAWMENWRERAQGAGVNVIDSVIARDYPDAEAEAACKAAGAKLV